MKVLSLMLQMPVGEGWTKPNDIINLSGVSHATVYRYLPKLEKEGYIRAKKYKCRELTCKEYQVTEQGVYWIGQLKESF